jgi:hypothetical protein
MQTNSMMAIIKVLPLARQSLRLTRNDTELSSDDAALNTDGGSELVIGLQRAVPLIVAPAIIDNK